MSESNTGSTAVSTPAPAAQPASQTPAAAPAPEKGGSTPDVTSAFTSTFGARANPQWENTPAEPNADTEAPAEAGHADGTEQPTPEEANQATDPASSVEQPQAVAPSEDDALFAELDRLVIPTGQETPAVDPAAGTEMAQDPDGEKPLNPNASPEERLKHAQSIIGRQGTDLGRFRTAMQQMSEHFQFDQQAGRMLPTAKGIVELSRLVPVEELNKQLASVNYKIAPIDSDSDADLISAVNLVIPGNDLTYDEKLAEIKDDPIRNVKMQRELARIDEAQKTQNRQREEQDRQVHQQQERVVTDFFSSLKALPYYDKELKPAIAHWNNVLPSKGPGAMNGPLRLQVLYRLAQLNRTPALMRELKSKVEKATRQQVYRELGMVDDQASSGSTNAAVPAQRQPVTRRATVNRNDLAAAVL